MLRRWPIIAIAAFVTLAAIAQVVVDPYVDGDLVVAGQVRNTAGQVYLFDAPSDSNTYGRRSNSWVIIAGLTNAAGITDAAADGVGYVRRNNAWTQSAWSYLTGTPTTTAGYGITDAATDSELASHASTVSGVHGITSFSSTLLDDTNAAAWRLTLGLGTAATKNVGTGSSDVAQGNHTHTGFDTNGTATAAIAAHEAASDPHSQYMTQTESDARFLKLAGGDVTGAINVGGGTNGRVAVIPGNTNNPGYLGFYTPDGTRRGYIGWGDGTSSLILANENGWKWKFYEVPTVNGSTIWHAGNDGSGSGLDADLLDGQTLSHVLDRANHTGQLGAPFIGGGTVSDTEFSYLDGLTSGIQSQLNNKSNAGHGHNAPEIGAGTVSNTEFGYLDGVTSSIQGQINALAGGSITIGISDVTGLQAALDAKMRLAGSSQIITADSSFIGALGIKAPTSPITPSYFPVFAVDPRTASSDVYSLSMSAMKTALGSFPPDPHGHSAVEIAGGTVDNTEFGYLDGVNSGIQSQLNGKLSSSGGSTSGTYTHTGLQRQLGHFQPQLEVTTSNALYIPIFLGSPASGTSDMLARSPSGIRNDIGAAAASHSHALADLPVAADGEVSATKLVRADDSRLSGSGSGPLLVASFNLNNQAVAGSTANVTVTANTSPLYYTVTHNLGNTGTSILLTCKTDSYSVPATACVATVTPNAFQVVISASNLDAIKRVYITIF